MTKCEQGLVLAATTNHPLLIECACPTPMLLYQSCFRGYNIGIRLVDEFLAKAKITKCSSFKDTADVIAKQALPMFLNIAANVTNWSPDQTECSLVSSVPPTGFNRLWRRAAKHTWPFACMRACSEMQPSHACQLVAWGFRCVLWLHLAMIPPGLDRQPASRLCGAA